MPGTADFGQPSALTQSLPLLSILRSAHAYFTDASLASLLFIAGFIHYVGQHAASIAGARSRGIAKAAGLLSFLAFGLTEYAAMRPDDDEVSWYLTVAVRAGFLLVIVEGAAAVALAILAPIWPIVRAPYVWHHRYVFWLHRDDTWVFLLVAWLRRQARQAFRRRPPPPPPPTPTPTLRTLLEQTKLEFEATCDNLRSAGLDEDELEAALLFARQKYLRRVHGLMNQ